MFCRFATIPLLLLLASCALELPRDDEEAAPIDDGSNVLLQGIIDCSTRTDTGYRNGNAFTITVVTADGRPVEQETANAYYVMQQAAAADGVNLRVVSGFRTMAEQQYLYGCYIHCNCNSCNLAASPGHSNHQSGHALDLNTSEGSVYNWLTNHGAAYGFTRTVPSEIWHWEWWGGGPGGGPCGGVDPQCAANPNYGSCNGSVITHCDNGHVSSGDCGVFGAACSVGGGTPHCVHPYCYGHGDGENGSWCEGNVIRTCAWGAFSEGDCGAFGAACSAAGPSGAHCVHPFCGGHGENSGWCEGTVARTCAWGAFSEGDCGFFGASCSTENGALHCVHPLCNLHGGENATWCEGNTVRTCAWGALTETDCSASSTLCSSNGPAHCARPEQPAPDAGVRHADAGVARVDSGTPAADGGAPRTDAGRTPDPHPSTDGGVSPVAPDAGPDETDPSAQPPVGTVADTQPKRPLGCNNSTPDGALAFLALLAAWRRRFGYA